MKYPDIALQKEFINEGLQHIGYGIYEYPNEDGTISYIMIPSNGQIRSIEPLE